MHGSCGQLFVGRMLILNRRLKPGMLSSNNQVFDSASKADAEVPVFGIKPVKPAVRIGQNGDSVVFFGNPEFPGLGVQK